MQVCVMSESELAEQVQWQLLMLVHSSFPCIIGMPRPSVPCGLCLPLFLSSPYTWLFASPVSVIVLPDYHAVQTSQERGRDCLSDCTLTTSAISNQAPWLRCVRRHDFADAR